MISLLGPIVERQLSFAWESLFPISNPKEMHKQYFNYGPLSILSYLIMVLCAYLRFAYRPECGHSNPVLRAETLVVHCQDDDSTPLINRTFRGQHQD